MIEETLLTDMIKQQLDVINMNIENALSAKEKVT